MGFFASVFTRTYATYQVATVFKAYCIYGDTHFCLFLLVFYRYKPVVRVQFE